MMVPFTLTDLIAMFGYAALLFAGAPALVLALVLLLVPACRRITSLRRTGWGLLVLVGISAICATPMLASLWADHEQRVTFANDTHHVTAPQILDGMTFPPGSTVHVNSYIGHVEFGNVPVPTLIAGLMLVGDFTLKKEYLRQANTIEAGKLAVPTMIHGIPCGRGALVAQDETTRCILDRDFDFDGFLLARGQGVEVYRSPLNEPAVLQWGTLARPELLYDVTWPAGTVIGGRIALSPARMAHGDGPQGLLEMCIAKGTSLPLAGAVLHGMMAMTIDGGRRLVSQVCSILPDEPVDLDGNVQVGAARYGSGERATRNAAWRWDSPVAP